MKAVRNAIILAITAGLSLGWVGCKKKNTNTGKNKTQKKALKKAKGKKLAIKKTGPKRMRKGHPSTVTDTMVKVAGLSWSISKTWKKQPKRMMRVATYILPKAKGDHFESSCVFYYFGPKSGGDVKSNIYRWTKSFAPDAKQKAPSKKVEKSEISGAKVTQLHLQGTFLYKRTPMAPRSTPRAKHKMLGAIFEGKKGKVFIKCVGPNKSMDASAKALQTMIKSTKQDS